MVEVSRRWEAVHGPHPARLSTCQRLPPGLQGGREQELKLTLVLASPPGHEDLFSCCQRKNFKGAPYSFFAIHITAALVLFMTDGMTVSLPSSLETPAGGSKRKSQASPLGVLKASPRVQWIPTFMLNGGDCLWNCSQPLGTISSVLAHCLCFPYLCG